MYAALSSLLLAAGCTCVTVQVNCSPAAQPPATPGPRVYGGNFAPVFGPITPGTGTQVIACGPNGGNVTVQKNYVDLVLPVNGQKPNAGDTAFVGHLIKSNTTTMVVTDIPNTDFLLRLTAGISIYSCCTSMAGDPNFVTCSINPIYTYRFKAYWRTGATVPAANETVHLLGAWTQ